MSIRQRDTSLNVHFTNIRWFQEVKEPDQYDTIKQTSQSLYLPLNPRKKYSQTDLFNKTILMIHDTLINVSIYNATPLISWIKSDLIMIPKLINNPQINRLRVINKFEGGFNLVLKLFSPKGEIHQLEKEGELNENQWRNRPRCSRLFRINC